MSNEIIKQTTQAISKGDIQILDRMLKEIEEGSDDAEKHKKTMGILKMKLACAGKGIGALKEVNISERNAIDQGKLRLEEEKFIYKKQQKSLGIPPVVEEDNGYWEGDEGLLHIKQHLTRFNQTEGKPPRYIPTAKELRDAGLIDLVYAIDSRGGFKKISEILGFEFSPQVQDEKHQA